MKRAVRLVPMVVVMGTIFCLSHQPASSFSLELFAGADKLAHALIYASLAATMIYGFQPPPTGQSILGITISCLVYGMTDEFHQSYIPGRMVCFADLLADAAGALLLTVSWYWLARRRLKK